MCHRTVGGLLGYNIYEIDMLAGYYVNLLYKTNTRGVKLVFLGIGFEGRKLSGLQTVGKRTIRNSD